MFLSPVGYRAWIAVDGIYGSFSIIKCKGAFMSTQGSSCVVLNQKGEVLLVLRQDFRIWALPGGGLEPNETWEQAAVRETLEETGYEVEILQYVGEYWRPQMSEGQGDLR